MELRIIAVGGIKESFIREGIAEYVKRMKPLAKISILEVPESNNGPGALCLKTEGKAILEQLRKDHFTIALAIQGRSVDSIGLADLLSDAVTYRASTIDFIIGGSLGLDASVLESSDVLLSFSKLTFPHQLMRLILVEQIYRSMKINRNEPYHK